MFELLLDCVYPDNKMDYSIDTKMFCFFILKGLQYAAFLPDNSKKQGEQLLHYVVLNSVIFSVIFCYISLSLG